MKTVAAWRFRCPYTREGMRDRLNALGPFHWLDRDNDRLGEYLSTRAIAEPDRGMIKIFEESDHWVLNVVLEAEETVVKATLDTVFQQLLPGLEATVLGETDPWE